MKFFCAILFCLCISCAVHAQTKYALVIGNGRWKVIDTAGHVIKDSIIAFDESLSVNAEGIIGYKKIKEGKYGIKNIYGQQCSPCIYDYISECRNGFVVVSVARQAASPTSYRSLYPEAIVKYGLISKSGKSLADTIYDYVSGVDDSGICILVKNDSLALIDTSGRIISDFRYKTNRDLWPVLSFTDGLLPVLIQGEGKYLRRNDLSAKVGFINRRGDMVIPAVNDLETAVGSAGDDLQRAIHRGGMCGTGMHNASEHAARHPFYMRSGYYRFSGGRCLVRRNGLNVVINTQGDSVFTIQPSQCDKIENMQGYFKVNPNNTRAYWFRDDDIQNRLADIMYTRDGQTITPPPGWQLVRYWAGHFIVMGKKDTWALMNSSGKIVSAAKFNYIQENEGYYAMTDKGVIDTSGTVILSLSGKDYSWLYLRNNGYVLAVSNNKKLGDNRMGMKDMKGEWIITPRYKRIEGPVNGYFTCRIQDANPPKCGYIDEAGRQVTEMKYDDASVFNIDR